MGNFISNDVVITEKELINEIINLKEKIRDSESERRNLRKIINLYKNLLPKITLPFFLTDIEGKIIYANNEFIDLLGYSMFDLKRMTIRSVTPMHLHQNEISILIEELKVTSKISGRFGEYIKINGEKINVELEVMAVYDERNNFDGILRIIKNIL